MALVLCVSVDPLRPRRTEADPLSAPAPVFHRIQIRGGIPIAFPIFATDKHPDYPELGGAHGFARISRWSLASQVEDNEKTTVVLSA